MEAKNFKKMMKAIEGLGEERNISKEAAVEIIKDAYVRAYKKEIERTYKRDDKKKNSQKVNSKYAELGELNVVAELNEKNKSIDLYQVYNVLESDDDVQDDELEIGLEEAREFDPHAVVGGTIRKLIENPNLSRADVSIAKNVTRQKVSELNKSAVYEEYKDKKDEMMQGVIESVKDKFTLVNLGRTVALMPHSAHIPHEVLREGDTIRVVITEVNKETKGSQVLVSRADPMLVRRLFEREVPEFKDGLIEIKAIARDAGERTKIAVMSHTDVDPVGACIGPHGQRVQNVINELNGEKIDIFEYSNDITELVKNALAPAVVNAVLPGKDDNSLLVIVDDNQLSLAIGKRGKNARLAVKLTNHKIDIKTRAEIEEAGEDYEALLAQSEILRQKALEKTLLENEEKRLKEAQAIEERRAADAQKLAQLKEQTQVEGDDYIPEEMMEELDVNLQSEMAMEDDEAEEEAAETSEPAEEVSEVEAEVTNEEDIVEETEEESVVEEETVEEEVIEEIVENKKSNKHADLEEMAANNTYVSKFEKLADTSKAKQETKGKKKFKKKSDEDNYKVSNKELAEQLKDKLAKHAPAAQPIYSDEELEEIEAEREAEEEREYDIDYDEYEDYYDEDN